MEALQQIWVMAGCVPISCICPSQFILYFPMWLPLGKPVSTFDHVPLHWRSFFFHLGHMLSWLSLLPLTYYVMSPFFYWAGIISNYKTPRLLGLFESWEELCICIHLSFFFYEASSSQFMRAHSRTVYLSLINLGLPIKEWALIHSVLQKWCSTGAFGVCFLEEHHGR